MHILQNKSHFKNLRQSTNNLENYRGSRHFLKLLLIYAKSPYGQCKWNSFVDKISTMSCSLFQLLQVQHFIILEEIDKYTPGEVQY